MAESLDHRFHGAADAPILQSAPTHSPVFTCARVSAILAAGVTVVMDVLPLLKAIPDVDVLLGLEPEEFGVKLLFILREMGMDRFHPDSLRERLCGRSSIHGEGYPRERWDQVDLALREACAWLEGQGLFIPAEGMNGRNGWRVLSRRARRFQDETELTNYTSARHLSREALHERIRMPVWASFMRGEFDTAVFQAMKAVEVAVREAADLKASDRGVSLMRTAFHVDTGPLTDTTVEIAERQARSNLFAGAIGSYKNPHSHHDVQLDNAAEAAEIVMLANHLLRIVDARVAAKNSDSN